MKKSIKHTVATKASPVTVWKIWTDIPNWNQWDHEIENSTINGPFQKGTTGTLKPKGGPKTQFTLTSVEKEQSFSDVSTLPLCQLAFYHKLSIDNNITHITHEISFTGPLAFLFRLLIGKKMEKELPNAMANLVRLAESYESELVKNQ